MQSTKDKWLNVRKKMFNMEENGLILEQMFNMEEKWLNIPINI